MKKSVGLVLSGGGARGAAHIGVLQALNELKIPVAAISGVSAGSVIGALYAAGLTPQKILTELKDLSYFSVSDFTWKSSGLFSMSGLRDKLEELIGNDSFEKLQIPLYIATTDITRGKAITFSSGSLFDIIIASSAVPLVFEHVDYQGYQLMDGGIINNFPVEPLVGKYDLIFGSYVNKLFDGITPIKNDKLSLVDYCFHLGIYEGIQQRSKLCDAYFEPFLAGFGLFEMKRADEIFEKGYKSVMDQKEQLLSLMNM